MLIHFLDSFDVNPMQFYTVNTLLMFYTKISFVKNICWGMYCTCHWSVIILSYL